MIFVVALDCSDMALKLSLKVCSKYFNQIGQKTFMGNLSTNQYENFKEELKEHCSVRDNSISVFKITKRYKYELKDHFGNKERLNDNSLYSFKNKSIKFKETIKTPYLTILKNIVSLAGYLHDIGKSNIAFQNMLRNHLTKKNKYFFMLNENDFKSELFKANFIRHETLSFLFIKEFIIKNNINNDNEFFEILKNQQLFKNKIDELLEAINKGEKSEKKAKKEGLLKTKENAEKIIKEDNEYNYDSFKKFTKDIRRFKELKFEDENFKLTNMILFLIITHHKLPSYKKNKEKDEDKIHKIKKLNMENNFHYQSCEVKDYYFKFIFNTHNNKDWLNGIASSASELLNEDIDVETDKLFDFVANQGRLALVLSDYLISREKKKEEDTHENLIINFNEDCSFMNKIDYKNNEVYANLENEKSNNGEIKSYFGDTLTEHLKRIGQKSRDICEELFNEDNLYKDKIINHVNENKRNKYIEDKVKNYNSKTLECFHWQYDLIEKLNNEKFKDKPFFGVAVAGTGTGKTIGCINTIMSISSKPRFTMALGLKTLTLQSFKEYEKIEEIKDDIALFVGNSIDKTLLNENKNKELNEKLEIKETDDEIEKLEFFNGSYTETEMKQHEKINDIVLENNNSSSQETYNNTISNLLNSRNHYISLYKENEIKLIHYPIAIMTIDHIIKGVSYDKSHNLLSLYRSLTSDIIIDEIDDYSVDDISVIQKLIYFVGLAGRKVIISSATVNQVIVEALYETYKKAIIKRNKLMNKNETIRVALISEFKEVNKFETEINDFHETYNQFLNELEPLIIKKKENKDRRQQNKIEMIDLSKNDTDKFAEQKSNFDILEKCIDYHKTTKTIYEKENVQKNISIGYVRFNNIKTSQNFCIDNIYMQNINEFNNVIELNDNPRKETFYSFINENPEIVKKIEDINDDFEVKFINYHSKFFGIDRYITEKLLDSMLKRENNDKNPHSMSNSKNLLSNSIIQDVINNSSKKNIIIIVSSTNILEVGRDHDYDWAITELQSIRSLTQSIGRVRRHRNIYTEEPNIGILNRHFKSFKDNKVYFERGYKRVGISDNKGYNVTDECSLNVLPDKIEMFSEYLNETINPTEIDAVSPEKAVSKKLIDGLTNFQSLKFYNGKYNDDRLLKLEHISILEKMSNESFLEDTYRINTTKYLDDIQLKVSGNFSMEYRFRGKSINFKFTISDDLNDNDYLDEYIGNKNKPLNSFNLSMKYKENQLIKGKVNIEKTTNNFKNCFLLDYENSVVKEYIYSIIPKESYPNLKQVLFSINTSKYNKDDENSQSNNDIKLELFYDKQLGLLKEK